MKYNILINNMINNYTMYIICVTVQSIGIRGYLNIDMIATINLRLGPL